MSVPVPTTPTDLLRAALAADGARPLVTYVDGRTGERTELSVMTFDNWVAKTAGLLVDGLDAQPGARVALRLPPHWQSLVWAAACWAAGCVAAPGAAAGDVVVVGPGSPPGEVAGDPVVALALRPLAAPGPPAAAGVVDYDREVRAYADRFVSPWGPAPASAPALEVGADLLGAGTLAAAAQAAAAGWGLGPRDRVLVGDPLTTVDGVLAGLLAPLAAGSGTVLVRGVDGADLARVVTQERVTAAGPGAPAPAGVPVLPPAWGPPPPAGRTAG